MISKLVTVTVTSNPVVVAKIADPSDVRMCIAATVGGKVLVSFICGRHHLVLLKAS